MRIAIDARKLRDFGIGTYIRNILIELSRLDQANEYVVLCRPDDVEAGEVLGRNFRMVPESAPTYSIEEQIKIPIALARERQRNAVLLGDRVHRRRLGHHPEIRPQHVARLDIVRPAQHDVFRGAIEPRQLDQDVADVRADAEIAELAGINGDSHQD